MLSAGKIIRLPRTGGEIDPKDLDESIQASQQHLLKLQSPDGYWCGELIVDSTLCSDYVLYMHWLGQVDPVLQQKCVKHIERRQLHEPHAVGKFLQQPRGDL